MKSINLLIKPASSLCNLRCRYCFYKDEAKNRAQFSMGRMEEETANTLIRQVFAAIDPNGTVSFSFQGGEPTMAGLPFFRSFVSAVAACRPAGVRVFYAIQTNGMLLDEQWARFFRDNRFLVGLSIDGIRAVHDSLRIDADGQGTWKGVLAARALLERSSVPCNALCVVTASCAEQPEAVYRSLKNLGFRYQQFIACLDPMGKPRGGETWSLTPERYGAFLCRLFDLWYRDWKTGNYHSIRLFDDYIHILLGEPASTCTTCGSCGAYLLVEGDGTVYPCDFYALDRWEIGSLRQETIPQLLGSGKMRQFLDQGSVRPESCKVCPYWRICRGGCKNDWVTDEAGTRNYYCKSFRALLDHAMPRMLEIARAERMARKR